MLVDGTRPQVEIRRGSKLGRRKQNKIILSQHTVAPTQRPAHCWLLKKSFSFDLSAFFSWWSGADVLFPVQRWLHASEMWICFCSDSVHTSVVSWADWHYNNSLKQNLSTSERNDLNYLTRCYIAATIYFTQVTIKQKSKHVSSNLWLILFYGFWYEFMVSSRWQADSYFMLK